MIEFRLPRVLHHAWNLGPLDQLIPPDGERYLARWRELHPDWDILQYDRNIVKELQADWPRDLVQLYYKSPNTAHRADILRLWLMSTIGGVWIDADMEPLRSLETLNGIVGGFVGRITPQSKELGIQSIEFAIIGAEPDHTFFKWVVSRLPAWAEEHWGKSVACRTGPQFLEQMLKQFCKTDVVTEYNGANITILPQYYFYPYLWNEPEPYVFPPGTRAVHHWWGTWTNEGGHATNG